MFALVKAVSGRACVKCTSSVVVSSVVRSLPQSTLVSTRRTCDGSVRAASSSAPSTASNASAPTKPDTSSPPAGAGQIEARKDVDSVSTLIPGVPDRAAAGLSPEALKQWKRRAELVRNGPVYWWNPAGFGQLDKVPDHVIQALPPPKRPLWPMKDSDLTWRYSRSLAIALFLVALAAYLQAKERIKGSARLALERRFPWLTSALVRMGVIQDYGEMLGALDRTRLFDRLFVRYADGEGDVATMPLSRAVALLRVLGEGKIDTPAALPNAAAGSSASPAASMVVQLSPAAASALRAVVTPTAESPRALRQLSRAQFAEFLRAGSEDVPDVVLLLAAAESMGVMPLPQSAGDALSHLYDAVIEARPAGAAFTPQSLAELSNDIGFSGEPERAQRAVEEAAARMHLPAPSQPASSAAAAGGPTVGASHAAVPLSRDQFIDYMAAAASGAQIDSGRIPDYLKVFRMLHLSGMREQAGVRAIA